MSGRRIIMVLAAAAAIAGAASAPAHASSATTQFCPRCVPIDGAPVWTIAYSGDALSEVITDNPINENVVEFTEDLDIAVFSGGCLPKGVIVRCDTRLHSGFGEGGPSLPSPTTNSRQIDQVRVAGGDGGDLVRLTGLTTYPAVVDLGPGNDRLEAPMRLSRVDCGAGYDAVIVRGDATVGADCENVTRVG